MKASEVYEILESLPTETNLFMMAKTEDEQIKRDISLYFTSLRNAKTALRGKDLVAMGFKPGPLFREIMTDLLKARLDQKIKSKEEEVTFVKRKYGAKLRSVDAASPLVETFDGHASERTRPRVEKEATDG